MKFDRSENKQRSGFLFPLPRLAAVAKYSLIRPEYVDAEFRIFIGEMDNSHLHP
jgi:hypothetical protein